MSSSGPRRARTVNTPGAPRQTTRSPSRIGASSPMAGGACRASGAIARRHVALCGPGVENAPMRSGPQRFAALATFVARVYAGYKWIQWTGGQPARFAAQHRFAAEGAYRLATRLEGLPIKVCQFLGSRADVLPAEYVEVLPGLPERVP